MSPRIRGLLLSRSPLAERRRNRASMVERTVETQRRTSVHLNSSTRIAANSLLRKCVGLFRCCIAFSALFVILGARADAEQQDSAARKKQLEHQLQTSRGAERVAVLVELVEESDGESRMNLKRTAEILELIKTHPNQLLEGKARIHRSWALQSVGDYSAAAYEAQRAESLLTKLGQAGLVGRACYMFAVAKWRQSEHQVAIEYAERAQEIHRQEDNLEQLANALTLLGVIYRSKGSFDESIEHHLQALKISEEREDLSGIARSRNNIGLIYWKLERFEEAYESLKQAMALYQELGSDQHVATCASNIGLILINLDQPLEALPYINQAVTVHAAHNNLHGQAKALGNLGFAQERLNNADLALKYYRETLGLRKQIGDKIGIVRTQGSIAKILQERDQHQDAIELLQETLKNARDAGARSEEASLHDLIVTSYEAVGDFADALNHLREYHEIQNEISGIETKQRIAELESQAEIDRSERKIRDLNHAAALKNQQLEQQRTSNRRLLIFSILLGGCFLAVVCLNFSRDKALRLMRESNSELLRTTDRLAESEQRYRMLFESADVPTCLIEESTRRIIDLNPAAQELYGSMPEEGFIELNRIEPKWLCVALSKLIASKTNGEYALDESWVERSGRVRWTELRGCSVSVNSRRAVLVSVRDTTDIRIQEQARMRADKLESLGQLAGGIAHDFNNALMAVTGFLAVAKVRGTNQVVSDLEMAEQAVQHAANLTKQLLAFSKGGEPVLCVQNVEQLLRGAVELASAGSRMHVEVDIADDLWNAELDSGQFAQVVSNLVINADHATGEHGLLEVSAKNFRGAPQTGAAIDGNDFVRIDFTDNGSGISANIRDNVFDPYFTTKEKGNGLGLTSAYAIMSRHNGDITFTSSEGGGAQFSLYFPATTKAVETAPPAIDDEGEAFVDSVSILVLDDEPLIQIAYRRLLEQWGHEVETVDDGLVAIERYRERFQSNEPFDVLILDLTIPGGLGGHEAITQILEFDPRARAIVSSGYSDSPIMANFHEAGFAASLTKPFRAVELASVLKQVLRSTKPAEFPN